MPVRPLCYTVHADSYLRIEKPKNHVGYGRLFTLSYEKDIEELKKFYNIREDVKIIKAKEGKK